MGAKNFDRLPFTAFYTSAKTVEQMQATGWLVISRCGECGLTMETNLAHVIALAGPGLSLWNRKERCRRLGCSGFVDFHGRHPRRGGYEPLKIDPREPE
jgi:hypothetical protein